MRTFNGARNFGQRSGGKHSEKKSFKKFDRGDSRDSFSPKKRFGEAESGTGFKLHTAVCEKCGRTCDLPFKPTGGKPVYCRSCFRAGAGNEPRHDFGKPEGSRSERFESSSESIVTREDIEDINRKLDKIMKALQINK